MSAIAPMPAGPPGSPYAAELEQGAKLRFAPELEAEFVTAHLVRNLILIRVTTSLALVMSLTSAISLLIDQGPTLVPLTYLVAVTGNTTVLMWLAFSSLFERRYLPFAQVCIPIRNTLVAIFVAHAVSFEDPVRLMVLPMLIFGPYFFLGLRFYAGLANCILTVVAYFAAGMAFSLSGGILFRSGVTLLATAVACTIAAMAFEKRLRTIFLRNRVTAELADVDALTGLKNRRVFDEYLQRFWQQAARDGRMLAILLVDIDHFKAYNDRYGHQAGDQALRQVAGALKPHLHRPLDVLARYGGEELAALLYDTDGISAANIAEQMRQAVKELNIPHEDSPHSVVTISIGLAVIKPTPQRKASGGLQLADEALYQAKARGRNRVEIKGDIEHQFMMTGVFTKPPA